MCIRDANDGQDVNRAVSMGDAGKPLDTCTEAYDLLEGVSEFCGFLLEARTTARIVRFAIGHRKAVIVVVVRCSMTKSQLGRNILTTGYRDNAESVGLNCGSNFDTNPLAS